MKTNTDIRKYGLFYLIDSNKVSIDYKEDYFNSLELQTIFKFSIGNYTNNHIELKKNNGKEFLVIPSYKNPRWLVPNNKKLIKNIGNIIKPSSLKAQLIWKAALLLNNFGLIQILFKDKMFLKTEFEGALFLKPESPNNNFVVYTGAKSLYQKFTIQEMDCNNNIVSFYKIGQRVASKERIKNEYETLQFLTQYNFNYFTTPKIKDYYNVLNSTILVQTQCESHYKKLATFNNLHKNSLKELNNKCIKTISNEKLINNLKEQADILKKKNIKHIIPFIETIDKALTKFAKLLEFEIESKVVFSHGDFSPWNIFTNKKKLYIYDWEMGDYRLPLFDYFNFLYHKNFLIDGGKKLKLNTSLKRNESWALEIALSKKKYNTYNLYFLIYITLHYLEQYCITTEDKNAQYLVEKFHNSLSKTI